MTELIIEIPVRSISEANARGHWAKRCSLHKTQKQVTRLLMRHHDDISLPCNITLVRLSPGKLDSDNLPVSLKYIRDTIADVLLPGKRPGMADNDPRLKWDYEQENSKGYSVRAIFRF